MRFSFPFPSLVVCALLASAACSGSNPQDGPPSLEASTPMPETGSDAAVSSDSDTGPMKPLSEAGPSPSLEAGAGAGPGANDAGDGGGDVTISPLPPFEGEASPSST
jgi:hypothetical protein